MGVHLRPGHKIEQGEKGWRPTSYEDFVTDIKVGALELGYWGKEVDESLDAPDRHSPLYSIPNPWASAYLYNYVMNDNTHPLAEPLIIQILNLLSDYALFDTVECAELDKPSEKSPFQKIWSMAPDFIKYGQGIWLFKNRDDRKVVGGLSKSSLVWTSQQYIAKREKADLLTDTRLISFLKGIKDKSKRPSHNFSAFWMHPMLNKMLSAETPDIEFAQTPAMPEDWLKRVFSRQEESDFWDVDSQHFVFDLRSLDKNRQILENTPNPPGFIDEIKKKRNGESLPMSMGVNRWIILDSLLESCWVKQNKVENSEKGRAHGLEKGFLYPMKPEYLSHGLELDDLRIDGSMQVGTNNAQANIVWKGKRELPLTTQVSNDTRSLAIWPPFESHYVDCHVIEYSSSGISGLQPLEFYSNKGSMIKCGVPQYHAGQIFRVYKLADKQFPQYIRFVNVDHGKAFGGLLKISQREKGNSQVKMIIGIDFGTSHTSIAYNKDGKKSLMTFANAKPIILTDRESWFGMLYNFLPNALAENKPSSKAEWGRIEREPWQPFQTQWMDFSRGKKNLEEQVLIQDGIIPFLHYASETTIGLIIDNLKWGAPLSIVTYRELFLRQLLEMAMVEAEAIGFEKLSIRWSYPQAFSHDQILNLESSWSKILDELKLSSDKEEIDHA